MCGKLSSEKDVEPASSQSLDLVKKTNKSAKQIADEVSNVVLGKEETIEMVMAGILANGNILFEDFPGLAKTLMSNTLADALGCEFKRIQFTPDLLPADITGSYFYDPEKNKFKFRKGPIFCNILLADEINRAPPKTQAALLEAMQEKQITIEGTTHKVAIDSKNIFTKTLAIVFTVTFARAFTNASHSQKKKCGLVDRAMRAPLRHHNT